MATKLDNLPILAPLIRVLNDEKPMLVFLWLISTAAVLGVPALAPWIAVIIPALVIIYGGLILHQGAEDMLKAWRDTAPASLGDAVKEIEKDAINDVLGTKSDATGTNTSTGAVG